MKKYKNEQRRFEHRGKRFHFISYDAQDANPKKQQPAMPATWYLESSGNRWPAIPQVFEQPEAELEARFAGWLEASVFAPAAAAAEAPVPESPQRFLKTEWIGGPAPS